MSIHRLPFTVLRAVPDPGRGEGINFGVVIFTAGKAYVRTLEAASTRLKALNPNYGSWNLAEEQKVISDALAKIDGVDLQRDFLRFLNADPAPQHGEVVVNDEDPLDEQIDAHFESLLKRLVAPHERTTRAPQPRKKTPKLALEIRQWLKFNKAFSTNFDDLSKHRVVANYPVDVKSDLYADFALKNGKLHVMEILDLRGMDHLTAGVRGEAALKGITLDEAREADRQGVNGIAVVQASNYGAARPAISLVGRYADDVFDLGQALERDRYAEFLARSLQRPTLLGELFQQ